MQVLGNATVSACLTRRALLATRAATSVARRFAARLILGYKRVAARLPLFAMHQTTIACFARRMAASLGRVYARAPASISLEAHLPARRALRSNVRAQDEERQIQDPNLCHHDSARMRRWAMDPVGRKTQIVIPLATLT